LFPHGSEGFADEFLVGERSVDFRGSKNVTPLATAERMREIISFLSAGGP
jgi:hypothetical protein